MRLILFRLDVRHRARAQGRLGAFAAEQPGKAHSRGWCVRSGQHSGVVNLLPHLLANLSFQLRLIPHQRPPFAGRNADWGRIRIDSPHNLGGPFRILEQLILPFRKGIMISQKSATRACFLTAQRSLNSLDQSARITAIRCFFRHRKS